MVHLSRIASLLCSTWAVATIVESRITAGLWGEVVLDSFSVSLTTAVWPRVFSRSPLPSSSRAPSWGSGCKVQRLEFNNDIHERVGNTRNITRTKQLPDTTKAELSMQTLEQRETVILQCPLSADLPAFSNGSKTCFGALPRYQPIQLY